jgi:hypothetical protein
VDAKNVHAECKPTDPKLMHLEVANLSLYPR